MSESSARQTELFQLAVSQPRSCVAAPKGEYLVKSATLGGLHPYQSHRFWILDAQGAVLVEYAPEFQCDCEYGLPVVYEMRDGTLFRYTGRSNDASSDSLCRWKADIVCVAHRRIADDDPDARRILATSGL